MSTVTRVQQIAVYQPAVRMVAIMAWVNADPEDREPRHELLPVIAMQAKLLAYGWTDGDEWHRDVECSGEVRHEPVIDFSDGSNGSINVPSERPDLYVIVRAVTCPWPPAEDEQRLAKAIARLKERAVEDERWRLKQEAREREEREAKKHAAANGPRANVSN
jgi:hypothetical protein